MTTTHSSEKRRHLRVFVLGAGVSAACGVPVAKDIFRATMLRLVHKDEKKAEEVHRVLRYLYPGFDENLKNYPNIEDFLKFPGDGQAVQHRRVCHQ